MLLSRSDLHNEKAQPPGEPSVNLEELSAPVIPCFLVLSGGGHVLSQSWAFHHSPGCRVLHAAGTPPPGPTGMCCGRETQEVPSSVQPWAGPGLPSVLFLEGLGKAPFPLVFPGGTSTL